MGSLRTARFGVPAWAALVLIALTGPLAAQHPTSAQQNAVKQNCRSDFQAHCAGVPAGGSAAMSCLQQNAASLSPGCQNALLAIGGTNGPAPTGGPAASAQTPPAPPLSRRQRAAILRHACGVDFQNNCHGVQPGGGRALECLMAHRDTLSPGCQQALASAHH
ncbi:MAG TPA: cysteine rich repeat-containing protein [Acetobacteraceae bacterium]|jgi:hypothetical protein|nr:cysteine rich repeat-containing protein [Acetobacteraceae bacterium]